MDAIDELERDVHNCLADCHVCHEICLNTLNHCLSIGGRHVAQQHIRLLLDCIEISQTNADFLLRGSGLHGAVCRACFEVCEACARDCDRLAEGDPQMQACAAACWDCAASCRQIAGEIAVAIA